MTFFQILSIVSAVVIIVCRLIAGFVFFTFVPYLAGYCFLYRNYDYCCHWYCSADFLLPKMSLYCQKFINIYIILISVQLQSFYLPVIQYMSSSSQENSNQQTNISIALPPLPLPYQYQFDSESESVSDHSQVIPIIEVEKQQIKKGLMNLPLFSNIIWMNDCQSESDKKIYPVLKLNFNVIYGDQFFCFEAKEEVLEYIDKNQKDYIKLEQQNNYLTAINAPVYLILCNNSLLPYFQTYLSKKKQVYKKCILFRESAQNTNENVYGIIKQAYDIIEIVQKLAKYLYELNYKNPRTMYRQFNVQLKNEDQIDNIQQNFMYNSSSESMFEGQLQPSTKIQAQIQQKSMLQQQQQVRHKQMEGQIMESKQIQSGQLDEIIQKYFVASALDQIMGTDLECRFDPSAVSLVIMTSSPECRSYQSSEILIRNNYQIKQLLQKEQKPKLIILTSQTQKQDEQISQNQHTYIWIKCKFPIQTLSPEQVTLYKTKYNTENRPHSNKIQIVTSIDQMEKVLRQNQDILENSML